MTGEELEAAYGGLRPEPIALLEFAQATPEELEAFSAMWRQLGGRVRVPELRSEPPTGVPVAIHEELRSMAAELATVRELLELILSALELEVVGSWTRGEAGRGT